MKKRYWAFVLYPESAPENWKEILQQTGLSCCVSPLHDKDINPTGDGIITAIQLLSMYSNYNKSLSELLKVITIYPQVTVNAKVDNDQKYNYIEDVEITEAIWNVEKELGDEGRILVRPSGTEPYVRVMIEGKDIDDITSKAKKIAKMIEKVSN